MANIIDITIRTRDETAGGLGSASKAGGILQGVFQGIGMAAGNIVAQLPTKIISFFGDAVGAAEEMNKVTRETERVIKTTGGAAGVSAGDVKNLAASISAYSGQTQEAVGHTENLLLTFTNVKNGVGKGNDIFTQATKLSLDMATALGTDASGAAIQLGKALNDPIKGISALSRSGVSFTQQQKDQIKTLVASGKSMEAQKIILAELSKEFGGAAATAATPMEKLQNTLHNLQISLGEKLLPIVDAVAEAIGSALPTVIDIAENAFGGIAGTIQGLVVPALEFVKDAVKLFIGSFTGEGAEVGNTLGGWMNTIIDFGATARRVFDAIKDVWSLLTTGFTNDELETNLGSLGPAVKNVTDTIRSLAAEWLPKLQDAFAQISDKVSEFWNIINGNQALLITVGLIIGDVLVGAVFALVGAMASLAVSVIAATWPFIAIVAAIFAVVAGLKYAYENWDWFRNAVDAVVQFLIAVVPPAFEMIRNAVAVAFEWIVNVAVPFVVNAFNSFMGFLQNTLLPAVQTVWNYIVQAVQIAVAIITPIISFLVDVIAQNFGHIAEIAQNVWDMIRNIIANTWQVISNIIQLGLNLITGNWGAAWDNVKNILSAVWDTIRNIVANGIGIIREILQGLGSFVGNIAGRLFEGIRNAFVSVINWIIDRWNGLSFTLPKVDFLGKTLGGNTIGVPRIARLAQGGITGGLALVGERGPELLNLPQGSRITPAGQTSEMLRSGVPIGGHVINVYVAGSIRSDRDLVRVIRDELTNLGFVGSVGGLVRTGLAG